MSQLKIKNGNEWIGLPAGGVGVPVGGTAGQVLTKTSNTDYDTEWVNQSGGAAIPQIILLTLLAASWSAHQTLSNVYTQTVTITSGTVKTKVDLQPDAEVYAQMVSDDVIALYVENDNGVFTAYAVGGALTADTTVQATRQETL